MATKDDIIAELRALVEKQAKQIAAQAKQIAALTQEVAELKLKLAKTNKDSSNSSKSPSSDLTGAGKDKKKNKPGRAKKRKIGGQPGHRRNLREPLPPERVDESIEYEINADEVCRLQLTPTGEFDIVQTIELPNSPVIVTEHRFALYQSPEGTIYYSFVPEVHNRPIFGPRLMATIGWLKSQAHCSYTTIDQYFDDVLGVPVSRGYLSKLCTGIVSESSLTPMKKPNRPSRISHNLAATRPVSKTMARRIGCGASVQHS